MGILNRRKLIKILMSDLATERTYFDFKRSIDVQSEPGRGRLVQDITALANSNRDSLSFIIVGVDDTTREIVGANPVDDVRIQQLVREYITPHLSVLYEIVPYPNSGSSTALGLLTIYPARAEVFVSRSIWKVPAQARYVRHGSERQLLRDGASPAPNPHAAAESAAVVSRASVNLEDTLTELLDFYRAATPEYKPRHIVYDDQHVVCSSGWEEDVFGGSFLSEVRVELLTEGLALFWSALRHVTITSREDAFVVCEHAFVFWRGKASLIPFQQTSLMFDRNGRYYVETKLVFQVMPLGADDIETMLRDYEESLEELRSGEIPTDRIDRWELFPSELLLAAMNGARKARAYLEDYMNGRADGAVATAWRDALERLHALEADRQLPDVQLGATQSS
jgi:hypothetical protein